MKIELATYGNPGKTLYIRNPKKNYAFEKIGQIAIWNKGVTEKYKSIFINGVLYELQEVIFDENR